MDEPLATLATMEDVRAVLELPRKRLLGVENEFRIRSEWLIALIDEIAASGEYPYNATVKRMAADRLGIPRQSDDWYAREGDVLSLLIYNAQCFRSSDKYRRDGFRPFDSSVLDEAGDGGSLEILSDGLMGSNVVPVKVRSVNGKLYAMRAKMRKSYIAPFGQPVRIVKAEAQTNGNR